MRAESQFLLCRISTNNTTLNKDIYTSLLFLKKRFQLKAYNEENNIKNNNYHRNCTNLQDFVNSIVHYYPKLPKHEIYIISYNLYSLHNQYSLQNLFKNNGLEYEVNAINEVYILFKNIILKYSNSEDLRIKKIQLQTEDAHMKLAIKILTRILSPRMVIRTQNQKKQLNRKDFDPCFKYKPYNIVPSFAIEYIANLVEIFKQGQNINKNHFAYKYFEKLHSDINLNHDNGK